MNEDPSVAINNNWVRNVPIKSEEDINLTRQDKQKQQ